MVCAHRNVNRTALRYNHQLAMSSNRLASIALIGGSIAGLVTMGLHPSGRDVIRNGSSGQANTLANAIHALALLAQPFLLAGTLAVTAELRRHRGFAILGYIFFAMASIAAMIAGIASGFIAPGVASAFADADAQNLAMLMTVFRYTGVVNQAFAEAHVMFASAALFAWSGAAYAGREFDRGFAVYGLVIAALLPLGLITGTLQLDVHGFGLVVVGETAWMVWAAAQLWRRA
jgi:hypothetical protein